MHVILYDLAGHVVSPIDLHREGAALVINASATPITAEVLAHTTEHDTAFTTLSLSNGHIITAEVLAHTTEHDAAFTTLSLSNGHIGKIRRSDYLAAMGIADLRCPRCADGPIADLGAAFVEAGDWGGPDRSYEVQQAGLRFQCRRCHLTIVIV